MIKIAITISCIFCLATQGLAQNQNANRSCSVVCLDDDWIPESYDLGAICAIKYESEGVISVHETNDVSDTDDYNRTDFISFRVAIHKKELDTMISFSDETYSSLDVQEILAKSEKGDEIIIILVDADKYSLPHHRITVL